MAIEVLDCPPHAPRHDLEGFFYVLIWMFTKYPVPGDSSSKLPGRISYANTWCSGSYMQMAASKSRLSGLNGTLLGKGYNQDFYPGWRNASTWFLVGKWWGLLFNKKNPLDMTSEEMVIMQADAVDLVESPESLRKEGLELSKNMIAALDEALERIGQGDAQEAK